ncbi:MAG: hypothetical protein KAJ40_07880 [Alphaproteobacteria bacterium]|nr:hypothetical protein [Alphaproteobacteria bacterium]
MRDGPHPLLVYLGLAAANSEGIQGFMPQRMSVYSQKQLTEMIRGIQMYQKHTHYQERLKTQQVWQSGTVKILKPSGISACVNESKAVPLLLIPSLINKSYIMDLAEEYSLLRWLNKKGIPTYLLDWGNIASEEENTTLSIAQLLRNKLSCAVEALSEIHASPIDVLGYCMGGTLLAGSLHILSQNVRKAVFLATPWDFYVTSLDNEEKIKGEPLLNASQDLAEMVRNWAPISLPAVKEKGRLPKEYTQSLFAALGARGAVHKFIKFVSMSSDAPETKLFVSAEDWLNDGLDLPGRIAHECIQGWFLDNEPAKGLWYIDDHCVNPNTFDLPCLMIAARKDSLVPFPNAYALYEQIPQRWRYLISPDTGHVGLIIGKNAVKDVWQPLLHWLRKDR